jgi:transcriptional regulator with XRE-family HTH domain
MSVSLRATRRTAGLTQAEVARRAGTTQSAVARAERPGANPRLETLHRMARALGHEVVLRPAPAAQVDLSQLRERLRLTPQERLEAFSTSQRGLARLRAAARRSG